LTVADSYPEDVLMGFALAIVLTLLAAIGAATWWLVGGNTAGWVITILGFVAVIFIDAGLDAKERYLRGSARLRRGVLAAAVVVAVVGSAIYILWPGTLSWYLIGVFGIPVIWVLHWGRSDDDPALPADFSDGPWTAP
jgi:hypothetical protein